MAGKELKFDIKLMTGTFERNFKRCTIGLMKGWRDFGQNMKKSNSFLEASNAVYMFGKKGVESITALFHPYEALAGRIIAVGYAVKKVCDDFAKFEKAGLKASYAFKGRGGTHDFDKFKSKVLTATEGGVGNATEVMGAVADARQEAPSLNNKELEFAIEMSKELAAIQDGDMASAVGTITDLLHKEDVTIEELSKAGLNLNQIEWQKIKALNGVWNQHKRNDEIMKLYTKHLKGASQEEAKTLAGMYKRMVNILDNLKMKLGQALAPIVKPFFELAVLIMNIAEGFIKPFQVVAKVIGAVFQPLTGLLTKCAGLCKFIGVLLGIIVAKWLYGWIKAQMAILALNGGLMGLLSRLAASWNKANKKVAEHVLLLQGAKMQVAQITAMQKGGLRLPSIGGQKALPNPNKPRLPAPRAADNVIDAVFEVKSKNAPRVYPPIHIGKPVGGAAKGGGFMGGLFKGLKSSFKTAGGWFTSAGSMITKVFSLIRVGISALSRFAGPVGLVIVALTAAYKFVQGFAKGFMETFNSAGKTTKSFTDVFKQVWSIISRVFKIIWNASPLAFLLKVLQSVGYYIGKLAGSIASVLLPAIESALSYIEGAFAKIQDFQKEAYFKFWEGLGYDMSKERAEYEKEKSERNKPKEDNNNDTDPRMEFDSAFESAASMNQRIQTSIMKKTATDPQARIADYLSEIKEMVKGLRSGQEQQVENSKNGTKAQQETNKKLSNLEPGLA